MVCVIDIVLVYYEVRRRRSSEKETKVAHVEMKVEVGKRGGRFFEWAPWSLVFPYLCPKISLFPIATNSPPHFLIYSLINANMMLVVVPICYIIYY